ncbi:MAG: YdcH family protein [Geminicoccaceae bacterium]|nr:YdcH family protein [Geminicoccaceae bacterium]
MALNEHVESLRSKHARLEQLIDDELHRPHPDDAKIARLKKEKLKIKDEIGHGDTISDASRPPPSAGDFAFR